jgi:hypothetical protein
MFGSLSYLMDLKRTLKKKGQYAELGRKLKNSGMPICIMAGSLAELEVKTTTMKLRDRDPRATMNAMHHSQACTELLDLAADFDIPLIFIPHNTAMRIFKFSNAQEIIRLLGLQGLLKQIAEKWYGEHLNGKCNLNDWVAFCAQLAVKRYPQFIKTESRQLHVGSEDYDAGNTEDVLVLVEPGSSSPIIQENIRGLRPWPDASKYPKRSVQVVKEVDRELMESLAKFVSNKMSGEHLDDYGLMRSISVRDKSMVSCGQ